MDKSNDESENKLVSSLKIVVAAGLGSTVYQALVGGIADIDYFRAITVGAVVAFVFFLFRTRSTQKSS